MSNTPKKKPPLFVRPATSSGVLSAKLGNQVQTLVDWGPIISSSAPADPNEDILEWLCPVDRSAMRKALDELDAARAVAIPKNDRKALGEKSARVGRLFEALLLSLFASSRAVSCGANVTTTTSEIDILLPVQPLGMRWVPMLRQAGTHLLGEAKCHKAAPASELITECSGNLDVHSANTALLFVACTSRKLNVATRVAIAVTAAKSKWVVPIGRKQLDSVVSGRPFLRVVMDQQVAAASHTTALSV